MVVRSRRRRCRRRWSRDETLRMTPVLVPVTHRVMGMQSGVQVRVTTTAHSAEAASTEGTFSAVQRLHHVAHHAAQWQASSAFLLFTLGRELPVPGLDSFLFHRQWSVHLERSGTLNWKRAEYNLTWFHNTWHGFFNFTNESVKTNFQLERVFLSGIYLPSWLEMQDRYNWQQ